MTCAHNKFTNRLISLALIFSAIPFSFCIAENFVPTGISQPLDVAQMGMGGISALVPEKTHSLFYNPALLCRYDWEMDIAGLGVGLDNDAIQVINFIDNHRSEFEHFEDLDPQQQADFIMSSQKFDNKWINVLITGYIGLIYNRVGAGLYSVHHADVKVDQGVFFPAVALRGYQDNVLAIGFGRPIKLNDREFDFGASLRLIERKTFKPLRIAADDANKIEDAIKSAYDEFNIYHKGFGIDLGLIRKTGEISESSSSIEYGIMAQDLIGYLEKYVKPNVKIGVSVYHPVSFLPIGTICGAEMTDFFNRRGAGLTQRINFGIQIPTLADMVRLRVGAHQGYPTGGVGFNFHVLKIDYAYFTRELGTRSGQFPESNHQLQLTMAF